MCAYKYRLGLSEFMADDLGSYNRKVEPLSPGTVPLSMLVVFVSAKLMAELFEDRQQNIINNHKSVLGMIRDVGKLAWV